MIKLLKPTKRLDDEVWRSFLSLFGTRVNSPGSFSHSLAPFGDTLCHILRLIEAGKAPRERKLRNKELHEICAWVVDTRIHQLKPQQRKLGWAYLLKQAQLHTNQRRRSEALKILRWTTALQPMTFGQWTAIPLTCGADLWEESVAMRHCADLYGDRCMSGHTLITSVRDSEGKRKATLAFNRNEGEWHLNHAVGPANRQVGKQFDELIDAILALLNGAVRSTGKRSKQPMYRIDVIDNFNFTSVWSESTYSSAESALSAARLICKSGLPTRDANGRESWVHFGETPLIISLGEAEPIEFCATEYINKLCGLTQHERSHHE